MTRTPKMAAPTFHVFLSQTMVAFIDKDRTVPYWDNLYQHDNTYFVDEGLMVPAVLHLTDCTCTDICNVQDAPLSTAPLPIAALPMNEGFSKDQTLFLIHQMGIHLEVEGEGPAKSLNDLNRRLRFGKKTKWLLWEARAAVRAAVPAGEGPLSQAHSRRWPGSGDAGGGLQEMQRQQHVNWKGACPFQVLRGDGPAAWGQP
ncbi:uncharacterized protein LOC121706628 [Alosa sapidissima]|uniref:uncharacterized protein LOC121706628 n=1 Tax=Alosa sapidissima TaxID=34773 RepID=UPI001C07F6DE|nr:uncharacterized protein LOC121706628 [Alosa sapidissima]